MTITSKYPGRCRVCGGRFQAGDRIDWIRGSQSAHTSCVLKATQESTLPAPVMDTYEEDYGRSLVASEDR